MKRYVGMVVVLMGVFAVWAFSGAGRASEEQEMPSSILIQNEGYKSHLKGPVEFSHEDHAQNYDVACTECHHDFQGGKNVWEEGDPVKKCASCHNPRSNQGKVKRLKVAFHKNCTGCHRELIKEGTSEEAPVKCNDCHQKKTK